MPNGSVSNLTCRLCNGSAIRKFELKLLFKYEVGYFECRNCGSLQTDEPHWLEEAYARGNLATIDTGAAQRNLQNFVATYVVARLFKLRNIVDVGGGDGLMCRLLRDHGLNCFVSDKYATLTYAQGYGIQDFKTPDLVVAFEVLEHFANPTVDLETLFGQGARVLLFSTKRYSDQSSDWWYLIPETGQHVFFYSKKAMELIALRYGYSVIVSDDLALFVKGEVSRLMGRFARWVLQYKVCRLLKAPIMLLPADGVDRDFLAQRDKSRKQ